MPRRLIKPDENTHRYESLIDFLENESAYPQGRIEIDHGLPIHLQWRDVGASTTVVIFTAAIRRSAETVPIFSGRRVTKGLPANVLMISDPTLLIDDELTLSWYTGNPEQPDLQDDLAKIIAAVAGDSRVVFFGGSGGGFAALYQAARRAGSTVIVIHPQTDITQYIYYRTYLRRVWGMDASDGILPPVDTSVTSTYSSPVDTQVVYVQNTGDKHVVKHQEPFFESLHPDNRALLLSPYLGEGHIGPGPLVNAELLSIACETSDWEEMQERITQVPMPEV